MSYKDSGPAQGARDKAPQGGGKPPKVALKARTLTFTITIPTFISICIGFAFSIIIVFFLGIILGRGHMPEERIPKLSKLMPPAAVLAPARVTASDIPQPAPTPQNATTTAANGVASATDSTRKSAGVMTAQDLGFRDSLKDKPAVNSGSKNTRKPADAAAKPAATRKPAEKTDAKATESKTTKPAVTAGTKNSAERFDYQFQVAAYKAKAQADAFTAKLKAGGFSAKTEKTTENGSIWYKNIVSFRGTPDDVDSLRAKLKAHKINTLIRKSKVPVK